MDFERHIDPKRLIGIGLAQQRIFKWVEEAAQWAFMFPGEYTQGIVDNWLGKNPQTGLPFFSLRTGEFNPDALFVRGKEVGGKFVWDPDGDLTVFSNTLSMVKWFKANVHFSDHPEAIIGLRECKGITNRVEELILEKIQELIDKEYHENKSSSTRKQ